MTAVWLIVGVTAWTSATLIPIFVLRLFRRLGRQAGSLPILHVLFAPAVAGAWWISAFFLTLADGDQDRGPDERGLGILLLPSMVMLIIVVGRYYGSLTIAASKHLRWTRTGVR